MPIFVVLMRKLPQAILFVLTVFCTGGPTVSLWAQSVGDMPTDSGKVSTRLLTDRQVQIDATDAINHMYNFNFERAEREFRWLKQQFPEHPLPYFLMGLSAWWKIVPNVENQQYDGQIIAYMDTCIRKAEEMVRRDDAPIEAHFFMAGANAFVGRLHSERKNWRKATVTGKAALNHLERCRGNEYLSPELLFGDGLYNYYAEWIKENYVLLRPVMAFFPNGDRPTGLAQLREVSFNAFYTRVEAQYFLMRIYANEENQPEKALPIAQYLHETFPNNAYFARSYARLCFTLGRLDDAAQLSQQILEKIAAGYPGYEAVSGRYAGFFLGYTHYFKDRDYQAAAEAFAQAVNYSRQVKAYDAGYFLHSLSYLARIADAQGRIGQAREYYAEVRKHADRKHVTHQEATAYLKRTRGMKDRAVPTILQEPSPAQPEMPDEPEEKKSPVADSPPGQSPVRPNY